MSDGWLCPGCGTFTVDPVRHVQDCDAVDGAGNAIEPDELVCRQCGADVWIDDNGVAYHWGGGITGIDHDLDADHVAVPDQEGE